MTKSSSGKHGGKREGASAPTKFSFEFKIKVGQTCEQMWRNAIKDHLASQKKILLEHDSDLKAHWSVAHEVPISERLAWLKGDEYSIYTYDFDVEIEELSKLLGEKNKGSRIINLSKKPSRGTRRKILIAVAKDHNLNEKQVDNIWQDYRELEKSLKSRSGKLE
jgi:hypothetical protein